VELLCIVCILDTFLGLELKVTSYRGL